MTTNSAYFLLARYFAFWAKQVLNRWQPIVIAVSGSAGKTTTLALLEAMLAPYVPLKVSHKANSATGIPLNILNLKQDTFSLNEWLKLIFLAPVKSLSTPKAKMYLCELDADRLGEMKQHMALLQPDITCFTSLFTSHTANYPGKNEKEVLNLMTKEFGLVLAKTKKLIIANGDDITVKQELEHVAAPFFLVSNNPNSKSILRIIDYSVSLSGTQLSFLLDKPLLFSLFPSASADSKHLQDCPDTFSLRLPLGILPQSAGIDLGVAVLTALMCNVPIKAIEQALLTFRLPKGRMSLFAGIKATTLIDSTYNASRVATIEALQTLRTIGDKKTVAILGDMRELGILSKGEHQAVAQAIIDNQISKVLLIGPMMNEFIKPILVKAGYREGEDLYGVNSPKDGLSVTNNPKFIEAGETILIKGSQNTLFLEGIVERLLAKPSDSAKLCRREPLWEKKRQEIYGSNL